MATKSTMVDAVLLLFICLGAIPIAFLAIGSLMGASGHGEEFARMFEWLCK